MHLKSEKHVLPDAGHAFLNTVFLIHNLVPAAAEKTEEHEKEINEIQI